jgi:hypothetical protein
LLALFILEPVRIRVGSEEGRSGFIARHAKIYDRTLNLYLQLNQPKNAFSMSERGRARAFLDDLITGYIEFTDDEATRLLSREKKTDDALTFARNDLSDAQV